MWTRNLMLASAVLVTCSCVTLTLAPGAEKVKLTYNAADVAGCKAVGNVSGLTHPDVYSETQLRNRTVGLEGDSVFVTRSGLSVLTMYPIPLEGVAYRCP